MDELTVIERRPVGPIRDSQGGQPSGHVQPRGAAPRVPYAPVPTSDASEGPRVTDAEILAHGLFEPKAVEDTLVAAAAPLLLVVAQLQFVNNADIGALHRGIVEQIRRFDERVVVKHQASDVIAARYVICALIDEAVMTTRWGAESAWSDNSLLNQFHNESWGGDKVFQILEHIQAEPAKHLALLKLIDVCLLMGFEGKYRGVAGGRERLEDLRCEVARCLRNHTIRPPAELSSQWRGVSARMGVRNYVPLRIVFTAAALTVLIGYGFFWWCLSGELAPVEQQLDLLGRSGPH
ncbi:type IVB secretion system protein IcmH/DotU [Bradyrhizobium sp. BEA-2-5]|uniref:type IVB secretion system protein IcmH/DotU n=1 Tax=Bradyrhizobium sp. BEA-2-5 TaxID=3080015 RepID=UPI00293E33F9|nr:type IVB secretion system protein IcmH/DotU [Bradyrhizobium sp. BEA-2-5]WOH80264.1 type IVB secretion system protein IcmH/DotU [Bradyrhizobium sp. BEA-2-5]